MVDDVGRFPPHIEKDKFWKVTQNIENKEDNFKGLIPKLVKRVGLLKQLRNKMNDKTFNMIANGIFTSLINYCISVFGNIWLNAEDNNRRFKSFSKEDLKRLQILQNQILRLKLRASKYTSCKQLIRLTGDLSIHQLIAYHTILQVHKVILHKKPVYIHNKLALKLPENRNIFPHRQAFTVPVHGNLTIARSAFMSRGGRLWNQLPMELRTCEKTESFKPQEKQWVKKYISIKPY